MPDLGHSILDAEVAKTLANKEHQWKTFTAPGLEPNWDYCERCGRKREDLKPPDGGTYFPCRGFI